MEHRAFESAGLTMGAVLLLALAPAAHGAVSSVEVYPGTPGCNEPFSLAVDGYFPDGCWSVTSIDFMQNGNVFTFVIHAVDVWDNTNCTEALVPYSAAESVGLVPEGTYWVQAIEAVSSLRDPVGDQLAESFEVCCAVQPDPVTDLRIEKLLGGWMLRFSWSDVGGAQEYLLYQDTTPDGTFSEFVDTATTGEAGIEVQSSFLDGFFLLKSAGVCGP